MSAPILRGATRAARAQSSGDGMPTLIVRFSELNAWYPIRSYWEGNFMERVMPGAFGEPEASAIRTLFNHGRDSQIGGKSLGVPEVFREADGFAQTEVPLLDTTYVRDLIPGLQAGAYGSSFMFDVSEERWEWEPSPSESNPKGLPERSLHGLMLYEAGPVTWPANPGADTQMNSAQRSGTDWYYAELEKAGLLGNSDEMRSRLRAAIDGRREKLSFGERARIIREMELSK